LTDIECYLEPAEGIERGGRLMVKGPNVMLGHLLQGQEKLIMPHAGRGPGWHDTGDIAEIDHEGFITILGRVKRFAKIGGEMVSLTAVEDLALATWPNFQHAAVNVPDEKKGERIVLYTTWRHATRRGLHDYAHQHGIGELHVPKQVNYLRKLPLLSTGKADYQALGKMVHMGIVAEDGIEN
jgi:acyl-[acyl-carrier-protein]-phospholipid O-acyltransferase/long-chain-fatty-acid--[acyl-carrier-protein] ligase